MLGQVDVLLALPFISRWSAMPVRLDAHLTSCRLQVVVQQYLGRLDAFPTMPFRRGWLTMAGRIDVLQIFWITTIKPDHLLMDGNVSNYGGTFRSGSDELPSTSCSTVLMGRLDAVPTLPFRS